MDSLRQTAGTIKKVNALKLILRQLTSNEEDLVHTRDKRGLFNFVGGISKILFGTLDREDASYHTDTISHLEMNNWIF